MHKTVKIQESEVTLKTKSIEQMYLEKEWLRFTTIRDYLDSRMAQIVSENEELRKRVQLLEDERDKLHDENESLRRELLKAQQK